MLGPTVVSATTVSTPPKMVYMREVLPRLGLVGALVLVNALFAGSEIALILLREGQIARLADHSQIGRTLARLARDPNRFLATVQVGITLTGSRISGGGSFAG